jgi:hypothetical protein
MKRLIFLIMLIVSRVLTYAQNNLQINIMDITNSGVNYYNVCLEEGYQQAVIYGQTGCSEFYWEVTLMNGSWYNSNENPLVIDIGNYVDDDYLNIAYYGCSSYNQSFALQFHETHVPISSTETIWKHQGESILLEVPLNYNYEYSWSTGGTTHQIEVTESGIYTCIVSDVCGTSTLTFIVCDNVEISLATCDLESNLNMVTWPTTVAQAEYIDHLNVKRDGMMVATANYSDGFFLDNIGSDAAPRTYSLIAVGTDGTECPIESYPKETIHMSYLLGVGNTVEVGWNQPSGYDLVGYNICEWNSNGKDGELTVIDFVGAGVTSYTCQTSQFDNGNIVVQGVEAGKTENRLLSNRSWELVGVGEQQVQNFKIYPNPSNGTFTVEGASTLTIYSMLGQIMATSYSENGVHSFTLAPGIYFIKSDEGISKKVVVQ